MYKSKFRTNVSPFGTIKYYHQDLEGSVTLSSPNYYIPLPLPTLPLAQNDTDALTMVASDIVEIKSIKVRGTVNMTNQTLSTTQTNAKIPLRLDVVMQDQQSDNQIVTRSTTPFTGLYLRPRTGSVYHNGIDITSSFNSPLTTTAKGFACVVYQQHTVLSCEFNDANGEKRRNPYEYLDLEIDVNSIFQVPESQISTHNANLNYCIGRFPTVHLTTVESINPPPSTEQTLLTYRITVSYAFTDSTGTSTY